MDNKHSLSEKGQTLVVVVIAFFAFVAVLALVLDGGNAYAAKRKAQNSADAGALAGAQYMCQHRNDTGVVDAAIQKAKDYAGLNGADNYAQVDADFDAATVVVTATVTKNTFFAGLIGFNQVSPRAVAEAACRPPGVGVLPVAWSCRENVMGEIECIEDLGPCRTLSDPTGMSCTYILMDSVKTANNKKGGKCDPDVTNPDDPNYCYCDPTVTDPLDPKYCGNSQDLECSPQTGTAPYCTPSNPSLVDCDIDNDCIDELATGGSRSWLDLNGGGGGAGELSDWISGDVDPPVIQVHTWLPEESGVATSIFHTAASSIVGENVILPVFDKMCTPPSQIWFSTVPETTDSCNYLTPPDDRSLALGNGKFFHVISFSAFHVTCVQTGNNQVTAEPGYFVDQKDKDCYGHALAATDPDGKHGPLLPSIDENDKSIEGYFVRLDLGGFGGEGEWFDTGTFTVVLVR